MTVKYQTLGIMAMLGFMLVFVSCSKSENTTDEGQNMLNSYNLTFKNLPGANSFEYIYSGSETTESYIGTFNEDTGDYGAFSYNLNHSSNTILGDFVLKENGEPLPLDFEGHANLAGSLLQVNDSGRNHNIKGVSGSATITNRKIIESGTVQKATFIVAFNGEFDIISITGETVRCIGSGKVEIGQPTQ